MHVGLGPGVRLTRREWGAVRRALGRPRRLSLAFLRQERAKLETYRNIVRAKYEEVRSGVCTASRQTTSLCQLLGDACFCTGTEKHDTVDFFCSDTEAVSLGRWAMAMRRQRRCPSRCTWGSV